MLSPEEMFLQRYIHIHTQTEMGISMLVSYKYLSET